MFLASSADIVIYGGAAGGGKSYALLLEPLRHLDNGRFGAVIFRKNANQVFSEGGLWDTAQSIYSFIGGVPTKTPKPRWSFPSGMRVQFGHLETDKDLLSWQGSQIPYIGFDELTHFSKTQFFYMLSRNRSNSGVKGYVRATTNPDADSWVADFIQWWIDQDTGYPILQRSGVIRWMFRQNDQLYWADTKEALWEQFSLESEAERREPKSVTFIASKLTDNKILMEQDPGYMANLKALATVERERLLEGNWKIRPASGLYFKRSQIKIIEKVPNDVNQWVRAWDFAATEERKNSQKEGHAAYTAGVLIGKRRNDTFVIADVINARLSALEVERTVRNTALTDKEKYHRVKIRLSQDPGQAGKAQIERYIKLLSGFPVTAKRESGSKETRAEPLAAQWQAGNVSIVLGAWNDAYLSQMESFPESMFKDMVDASANGFHELSTANMAALPPSESLFPQEDTQGWSMGALSPYPYL